MRLFPIIPLPEAQLPELLSIARAEERCEDFSLADDVSWLAESNGEGEEPSWTLLKNLLSYGSLRGFVFSHQLNRWGELPAAWWFSAGDSNPHSLPADNGFLRQIGGEAFALGPLAVGAGDIGPLLAELTAKVGDDDGCAVPVGSATSPRYAIAEVGRAAAWLVEQFEDEKTVRWNKPDWEACVLKQFPKLSRKAFLKAWDRAVAVKPGRAKRGPKPVAIQ